MNGKEIILEESRNKLNRQIEEIRNQRRQALKMLRMYFAAAAIIMAGFTTYLTAEINLPFQIQFMDNYFRAPVIVLLGTLLLATGFGTFSKGIYNCLDTLSAKSIEVHPNIQGVYTILKLIIGKDVSDTDQGNNTIQLGPDLKNVELSDCDMDELTQSYAKKSN